MLDLLRSLRDTFGQLDARNVLDILLITAVVYWLLLWLRGTSGMSLLRGLAIVAAAGALLGWLFNLTVVDWLLRNSLTALLVAVPIIFQPEIRRTLERVGRTGIHRWRGLATPEAVNELVADAALELSRTGHGALIVLEGETGLEDYVATGIRLDALPSLPLLLSIFSAHSAIHDGAIIIREGRIASASCTLPLAEVMTHLHLGTRHRAALGISERTDGTAIVVSEESGSISLATDGRLFGPFNRAELLATLNIRGQAGSARPALWRTRFERGVPLGEISGDGAPVRIP